MTQLKQRFAGDMQIYGLALTTQRRYLHYEWNLSPESVKSFISSVQFL